MTAIRIINNVLNVLCISTTLVLLTAMSFYWLNNKSWDHPMFQTSEQRWQTFNEEKLEVLESVYDESTYQAVRTLNDLQLPAREGYHALASLVKEYAEDHGEPRLIAYSKSDQFEERMKLRYTWFIIQLAEDCPALRPGDTLTAKQQGKKLELLPELWTATLLDLWDYRSQD